jgi:CDP-diacylglycerol--glycerol-3-phosphate 3-phosphatidyltransferase
MATTARDVQAGKSLLNLPNKLTSLRLGLSFVLFAVIWLDQWLAGLTVFVVAALTDWLDGYYARKRGLISSLGRVYDPLVDKVLVSGSFIFLLEESRAGLNAFMVTVVVAREFIVTGLRGFLEEKGVSFGADWLGKTKMVLQCAAIIWILLSLHLAAGDSLCPAAEWLRDGLNWSMVAVTIASGANYIHRAIEHLT